MNEKQLPDNSPLNKNLIAWSDLENYTKLLRRRIIFLQEGNEFAHYVEYINEDDTRNMIKKRDYCTCITVAYHWFRNRFCGSFSSDLQDACDFTMDNEKIATIDKGHKSIAWVDNEKRFCRGKKKVINTVLL